MEGGYAVGLKSLLETGQSLDATRPWPVGV
jgi:hypothetical protein